jgi:hypothetical protein
MLQLSCVINERRWSTTSGDNVNSSSTHSSNTDDVKQQAYADALQWQQLQKEMGSLLLNHQLTRTNNTTTSRKRSNKQRQYKPKNFSREFEALKERFGINRTAITTDTTTVFNLTAVDTRDDADDDQIGSYRDDSYNNGPETCSVSPTDSSSTSCASRSAVGSTTAVKACSVHRGKHWKPNCRPRLQWTTTAASDSGSGIAHYIIADTAVPRCKSYTTLQRQPSSSSSSNCLQQPAHLHESSFSSFSQEPRLSVTSTSSIDNSATDAAAAASAAARRNSFTSVHKPKQAIPISSSSSARRLSKSGSKQYYNEYTDSSGFNSSVLQHSAVHHVELPLITGTIDDNSSSVMEVAC